MNGIHDMGGMDGFGPVQPELNESVFHAKWEGEVMAISRVMGAIGAWNIDQGHSTRSTANRTPLVNPLG